MSLFTMSFMGVVPIGNLLAGSLASYIGVAYTLAIAGIFCMLAGLIFYKQLPALKPLVRPIYKQLGIIPID